MRTVVFITICIFLFLPLAAQADLYRWQDSSGEWHFCDDPSKIPERYRDQVKREALPESPETPPPPIVESGPVKETAVAEPSGEEARKPDSEVGPKTYMIEYTETEYSLKLDVTINENHTFPFLLDTGATFVSLSKSVGKELGYNRHDILPRIYISTANGLITCSLVRLDSVQVGDAVVRDVTAIVCGDNEDEVEQDEEEENEEENIITRGALGLSFLNEFDWSNDTMEEVLTLKEFSHKPEDDVYGGHNEKWWRKKFKAAKKEIKETEEQIELVKDNEETRKKGIKTLYNSIIMEREIEILKANRDFFREELAILDRKANRYEVPRSWR